MELALSLISTLGLGVGLPLIVAWIGRHVSNAALRDALDMAVKRAGGIAYDYMAARAGGMTTSQARIQAVNAGYDYLANSVPDILRSFGVQPETMKEMVHGELGKLLAVDPNVTVPIPARPVPAPVETRTAGPTP